ncbi:TPA: response regulator [Kluyvera intermedia]|uniref:histidine kinase n=2 Tax=Enterobacteriaceae TaxID=543 RepID=A0AAC8TP21_9ENTR|nr:ATP-binding protein [Phytobacter ursingii]HAT2204271.1 response regulator [Kluyvera intermedia]AKL14017.1 histidine kinase [Phytobacter ursingii]HAT2514984.1 response regulator [Kluyvera intermedia]HAT2602736.1 response regulator [Kluyvera intermedia]HAT2679594.1 response regulator [Kluyvera intermedia]
MPYRHNSFFASARGRLLFFNLLVMTVTLMVCGVAVLGFRHASQIQEQVQQQTLDDMTGSMNLARDTANVATAAVRLSQVVGALEYKSEAERLKATQMALQKSLEQLARAPLAQLEPQLVERITWRSNELEQSVTQMLERGQRRHLERNALLSSLYQNQSYLRHLQEINLRDGIAIGDPRLLGEMDRLLAAAIRTPSPRPTIQQLTEIRAQLPDRTDNPVVNGILQDFSNELAKLGPLAAQLDDSDLAISWFMFHIKALVAILNTDINQYVAQVAQASEQRTAQSHSEMRSIIIFISAFALLALVITGFAGWYIYRNLGSNLTAISRAMSRLARGEPDVPVPALQRRDELGELARAFNVFARNTASLEHTSKLLKEKSTQLETTFHAMRDGFALFDSQGCLVVWNPQYPLLLGLSADALQRGQHYQGLLRQVSELPDHVQENLARPMPKPQELRLADNRTIELRFSPVPGRGMVNVVLDRTERKGLEEALLHSQKMKAVGQLTGGLAHDFNNLLAVIIGSLELVNPQSPDAPRISRALKAAERGAMLTQRLLAFSRKQSLHPHAVEMQPLLENLSELMRHSLPATLTLEIEAQQPAWPAWIDVGQLENAIINLVMNARDAMEGQKGTIKIRTWNQRVTRSDGRRQDMVALEVIDRGCGMSQDVKARVFEPFFTTKQTGSGSGLGLSMVYGFVRQSGGRVAIDSVPGQGTTVRLQLPRASVQVVSPVEPLPAQEADRTDKLILVLEDEADVRQTLCEQLHGLGYLTLEAECGEQALALLAASEDIGMLISDLMLPGQMSGAEVINYARQHYPHLPLLLISGQDLRPVHNPALPDVELLRKPFTRVQLAQALRRIAA